MIKKNHSLFLIKLRFLSIKNFLEFVLKNEKGYPVNHPFEATLDSFRFIIRHAENRSLENIEVATMIVNKYPLFSLVDNVENLGVNG